MKVYAGADTRILKRRALRISVEESPTMVGGDMTENFDN